MRVPYTWLKDFVDTSLSAGELAELLTRSGVEVEEIVTLQPDFTGVVVVEVLSVDKHPEADKLFVVKVSDGCGQLTVVAGIDNMVPGDKVPLAKVGASLPGNLKIRKTKLRGVESQGMLCSAEELGLELNPGVHGILVLDRDTTAGLPLEDALLLNDPVLVLGLTPNRSDCLGLLGVAHEVSALTGQPVQMPDNTLGNREEKHVVPRITVKDSSLCPRYAGLVVANVNIALSPIWLQIRLLQAGLRPISNIVDVTNYVMWEWGQPLHAFDYELLADHTIIVRTARPGETILTLDNKRRELAEEMLVIADAQKPVAVAGVMGGLESEITPETRTVLLESAHFNPVSIRRTGRSLGLYSEAQQRFEKGVDVNSCAQAIRRAARLIEMLGAGNAEGEVIDEYVKPCYPVKIRLRPERARQVIGLEISQKEMVSIFQRQGFSVEEGTQIHVTVPTRRADLQGEVDLIEEVARINGYEKIATTLPWGVMTQGRRTDRQQVLQKTRQILVACGYTEAITYSFVNPKHLDKLRIPQDSPARGAVFIANPLSEDQSMMRTGLLGGLLETVAYNVNRNELDLRFFELGAVYLPKKLPLEELPQEKTVLGLLFTGSFPSEHWRDKPAALDFFDLKGVAETLVSRLGITNVRFSELESPVCQPGQAATVIIDGQQVGWLGKIHPEVLDAFDLEKPVYAAELDMEQIIVATSLVKKYTPLPRYPALLRDLAVIVPDEIPAEQVCSVIKEAGGALVEEVALFDHYRGPQIPAGFRNLAFAIFYRDSARTLSDSDVADLHQNIENTLTEKLHIKLRR